MGPPREPLFAFNCIFISTPPPLLRVRFGILRAPIFSKKKRQGNYQSILNFSLGIGIRCGTGHLTFMKMLQLRISNLDNHGDNKGWHWTASKSAMFTFYINVSFVCWLSCIVCVFLLSSRKFVMKRGWLALCGGYTVHCRRLEGWEVAKNWQSDQPRLIWPVAMLNE